MRAILAYLVAAVLCGCATNPAQEKAQEGLQQLLYASRNREIDLTAENIALKRQLEKLAQELGDANAQVVALRSRMELGAAPTQAGPATTSSRFR